MPFMPSGHDPGRLPRNSAPDDPGSERKFVTILRADVVHSTNLIAELDPEQAISRLEPALAAMRSAVRQFGGIVSKEMGDGLSAVFGAPVADDNHAPLACHAALELVRRVAGLGDPELQVRVGLHSGFVVAYVVAGDYSKVYEIGGAAQHLAARLETAAEAGQIFASEACQKLAEGDVRFEFVGPRMLRGFAEAVPIYRVVSANDLSSWRVRKARSVSQFVNRSVEHAQLWRAAEAARASSRGVLLTGAPGIGKSRLVHEFVQGLESKGWRLIEVECSPNLQSSPFAALKGLLLAILNSPPADDRPGDTADPRASLPPILRAAVHAVLDLPIVDEQWDGLEPQARGRAIREAGCALVENLAKRQPTLLLIEDLHWIDRASDPIVAAVAALKTPDLLMLFTGRPNGAPDWASREGIENLTLRPLDESSGRAMLDAILGSSATTVELKSRIIRHTANVPLFVEEVCRRLKETGVLQGQWGDLTVMDPVEELGIPNSIQGVIAARLDRLAKQEYALIQTAAALGPRASLATLREVSALDESALQSALAALDRAEMLVKADGTVDDTFEFPHEMVRQVAYDSLIARARESVHASILSALEKDERWSEEADTLCYHATRAKNWPKAFTYARNVARKCVERSAFADATSYFETAMDALDKTPISDAREADAIDLRIEARMGFMGFGKVAEWLELGNEAERRANAINDIGRKVAAMTIRAAAQNFYDTPVEAIATGERVIRLAEQWGNIGWLNLAAYGLGQAYHIAGRYREAEEMLGHACTQLMGPDAAAPIGTRPQYLLLMCCMMKSLAHVTLGEIETADQFQRRADEIAAETNRPFDRVAAACSAGNLALGRGDARSAADILDEAFALAQEHGLRLFAPIVACHRGMAYLELGHIELAREILAWSQLAAETVVYKSTELRASIYLALAIGRAGEVDNARDRLRVARNRARQQGFGGLEAEALLCEAMVTPAADDDSKADIVRNLQACIAIAAQNGAYPLQLKAEALLKEIGR
jgi:class 3 adenylate cyclase/tetratricopeptide (TPR) repeat protein